MGVNRLNPVQKATYLKKIKSGENEECTVTVKTATDQFRAISALISAASPEKWIGMLS